MPHPPSVELAQAMQRTLDALLAGDLQGADTHMQAAADLCRRLQAAGLGVPEAELGVLRTLADRCGESLARAGRALNASCHRDENHRRGIVSYHAALLREVG